MLYVFGFEKVAVVVGDLYFHYRGAGYEEQGAEHGVRLEVRKLDTSEPQGSESGSRRFTVDEPVWRADLLQTVTGPRGSHDRTHFHPGMRAWNGGERIFDPQLTTDPASFVASALSDLDGLLAGSDFDRDDFGPNDAQSLRDAAPEISELVGRLLERVEAGELGRAPELDDGRELIRTGWM